MDQEWLVIVHQEEGNIISRTLAIYIVSKLLMCSESKLVIYIVSNLVIYIENML